VEISRRFRKFCLDPCDCECGLMSPGDPLVKDPCEIKTSMMKRPELENDRNEKELQKRLRGEVVSELRRLQQHPTRKVPSSLLEHVHPRVTQSGHHHQVHRRSYIAGGSASAKKKKKHRYRKRSGSDRRMDTLIRRSLSGHRMRSSLTFLMFTISVATVIFGGVVFGLLSKSLPMEIEIANGADIHVQSLSASGQIPQELTDEFLRKMRDDPALGLVKGWTYIAKPLSRVNVVSRTRFSNMVNYPPVTMRTYGVEENFLDVAYSQYFLVADVSPEFKSYIYQKDHQRTVLHPTSGFNVYTHRCRRTRNCGTDRVASTNEYIQHDLHSKTISSPTPHQAKIFRHHHS
jgi:hypothetical protein